MPEVFDPANVLLHEAPEGTVPAAQGNLIIQHVIENSKIMQLGKIVDMKDKDGRPTKRKKFTFLAEGPGAYWVGEGEKIQTSKATWLESEIVAHKLGVIIPVSREFLYYSVPRFFEEVKPLIAEAFYKKFDEAGILNEGNPFEQSIEESAVAAGNVVEGAITYDNLLALEDALYDDGVKPNAFISKTKNNSALRQAVKTENGVATALFDRSSGNIDGLPTVDLSVATMPDGTIYAGDFNHLYYGIPYALTYQISTEAQLSTIKNEDGSPVNLFEQELIALRATMDVALMITKDGAFAKLAAEPTEVPTP